MLNEVDGFSLRDSHPLQDIQLTNVKRQQF